MSDSPRLVVNLTEKGRGRLARLVERFGNRTAATHKAIEVLDLITQHTDGGGELILVDADGKRERVLVLL